AAFHFVLGQRDRVLLEDLLTLDHPEPRQNCRRDGVALREPTPGRSGIHEHRATGRHATREQLRLRKQVIQILEDGFSGGHHRTSSTRVISKVVRIWPPRRSVSRLKNTAATVSTFSRSSASARKRAARAIASSAT